MIIFLGDSFTWGQGLYSKKWIQEGKSIEYCNDHLPPTFPHGSISYSDDEYRRTHHFPNLVAKHYNLSYYTKPKNGGSNGEIENITREITKITESEAIDLVVIQFTEFMRDLDFKLPTDYYENSIEEFIDNQCREQIQKVFVRLTQNDVKNFIFFSWHIDIGEIIKKDYPNQYTPLYYKEKEYNCFNSMIKENPELDLAGS